MKVCVKAWQNVINPSTGKIHDDLGLKTLDALLYGPVRNVERITPKIRDEMIEEFHRKNPKFRYDCLEILTDEEEKSDAVL